MGLYAVSEQTLAHSDRVLSRPRCSIEKPLLASFCNFFLQTGKNNMEASIHDTSVISDSTTTKASTTANRSEVYTDRIIIIRCDYIMNTEKTHLYIDWLMLPLSLHEKSSSSFARTVGTIDIGTNPSEPTSECGLRNRENPSEPTTPSRARRTEKRRRVK